MTRKEEIRLACIKYVDTHPSDYTNEMFDIGDIEKAFEAGAEWAGSTMIEKACEWLKSNLYNYAGEDDKRNIVPFDSSVFEDFRKAMEE